MTELEEIEAELVSKCWWCKGDKMQYSNKHIPPCWCVHCGGSGLLSTCDRPARFQLRETSLPPPYADDGLVKYPRYQGVLC